MLSKLVAVGFMTLIVLKLLFKPQLRQLGKWLNGFINAMLIAICIAYTIQLFLWFTGQGR